MAFRFWAGSTALYRPTTTSVGCATTCSGDRWAFDTSVAIAALDPTHQAHRVCRRALVGLRPAVAGHAVFETCSVLTRLVGQAAAANGRTLLTRDRRAERTYRSLAVAYRFVQ